PVGPGAAVRPPVAAGHLRRRRGQARRDQGPARPPLDDRRPDHGRRPRLGPGDRRRHLVPVASPARRIRATARGLYRAAGDRDISRGVHPAILSQGGLGPALRSLTRRASLPAVLDIGEVGRLPQPVEVAAYYVVSEALTNAAKHANATVVHVRLGVKDTTLRI